MDNRINVEKEIRESKNHEQFKYLFLSAIGVFLPFIIWVLNYEKITSPIWWGFFTVMMFLITVFSFVFGVLKISATAKALRNYQKVLNQYANIDEGTHIPETAHVTMCLRTDMGRFGFQKVNYFFWKDQTELVFFPVRPEFLTSDAYHLVQSVRLNEVMIRSYSMTGNQYYDGIKDAHENQDPSISNNMGKNPQKVEYRDTRATLIAYAIGEQTIYLMFDSGLYEKLKVTIPLKDKKLIDAKVLVVEQELPVEEKIDEPNQEIKEVLKVQENDEIMIHEENPEGLVNNKMDDLA